MKQHLESLIAAAMRRLREAGTTLPDPLPAIEIERARSKEHGDFTCNIALALAKPAGMKPRELAERIVASLPPSPEIKRVEMAGPGFINFHLRDDAFLNAVRAILREREAYGRVTSGAGQRVLIEFVSANPTGPLHVGHGRQAALGDALAALLDTQGYAVVREFYYNDAGVQIQNLALSVQARARGSKPGDAGWPAGGYNGEYVQDIADEFRAKKAARAADGAPVTASGDVDDLEAIRKFAVTYLRHEQDIDLQKFGVKFDNYYLESSLYEDGRVEAAVKALIASGKTYEKDGALWLRTTDYGDDKDRVMRKSDGSYTYFVPDVAYHVTKWERGYRKAINIQGSDHHGTIARVRAALQALGIGIPRGYPDYVLHSLVRVMRAGEEVKISKRAGSYVTLRDLIEWVGRDAARFFLVSRRADSQFVFDIDLALAESEENPVYYVQYAHARVCSVFKQLKEKALSHDRANGNHHLGHLTEEQERTLMNTLGRYPDVLTQAATEEEPQTLATYLRELARDFHLYYNSHKFLIDDPDLRDARLNLIEATRQVVANGLALLGVTAPTAM